MASDHWLDSFSVCLLKPQTMFSYGNGMKTYFIFQKAVLEMLRGCDHMIHTKKKMCGELNDTNLS